MVTVLTPPTDFKPYIKGNVIPIFLAGTIDMGNSENWQQQFIDEFKHRDGNNSDTNFLILNPRREFLDDTFFIEEQIEWELSAMDLCEYIMMFLLEDSKSPVTMLEYGLFLREKNSFRNSLLHVSVSKNFYRYDNIYCTNRHYGYPAHLSTYENLSVEIEEKVKIIYNKAVGNLRAFQENHKHIYSSDIF